MNWQAIGAIGELAGAVGVIATLGYLAFQIRQNNELLRSESRQALVANDVTSLTASLENTDVFAKLVSEGELSADDQLRLSFIYAIDLRNREFEYRNGPRNLDSTLSEIFLGFQAANSGVTCS